jgi:hypothetical protein
MLSKVYSVKSNAARAAKAHGLTRENLIAVSGGWQFALPGEGQAISELTAAAPLPAEVHGADLTNEQCAEIAKVEADVPPLHPGATVESYLQQPIADEPDVTDEELLAARAAHTVVNGAPVEPVPTSSNPYDLSVIAPAVAASKPPRQRREKAAGKPKAERKAKTPRKAKVATDGPTKRGTKAYADKMAARRRAGMNKRGITALVMKEIRVRWTPTSELLKMTGWQPTTLRGVLSLYAKKHKIEIKGRTVDGERQYFVAR